MATTINTQWAIERGSQSNPLYQIASAAAADINAIQSAATTLTNRVTAAEGVTQHVAQHTTFAGSTNTAITLLKANIAGSAFVSCDITSTAAGPIAATLDTAVNIVSQITQPYVGQSYRLRILNGHGSETVTITTNTGLTLTGTMTIANGTYRDFIVTLTSLTAVAVRNLGSGSI